MALQVPQFRARVLVCDMTGAALSEIDTIATAKQLVFVRNRPATFTCTVPSDDPRVNGDTGSGPVVSCSDRILKVFVEQADGTFVLRFAGPIMNLEDNADANRSTTNITAYDPSQLLYSRLVCEFGGTIDTVVYTSIAGNTIAKNLVDFTASNYGPVMIDTTGGTFDTVTAQTVTFEEGYTVGQALELLTSVLTMDVVFDPLDGFAGLFATMSVLSNRGSDKPNAIFGYDTVNYAVASVRRLQDGTELSNDVRVAGGRPATGSTWPTGTATDSTSITKYGRYQSWDAVDPDISDATLLGDLAAYELALRKSPREYLYITPFPEKAPQPWADYFLGDTIHYYQSANVREPLNDYPVFVQGITVDIDDNGFARVGEIQTVADL